MLLMPMLGVAWLIGFAVNAHISIGYIFDVLSSLQVTLNLVCFFITNLGDDIDQICVHNELNDTKSRYNPRLPTVFYVIRRLIRF